MTTEMVYTEYMKDICEYLKSKFPDIPEHEITEASTHVAQRTIILVNDLLKAVYTSKKGVRRIGDSADLRG